LCFSALSASAGVAARGSGPVLKSASRAPSGVEKIYMLPRVKNASSGQALDLKDELPAGIADAWHRLCRSVQDLHVLPEAREQHLNDPRRSSTSRRIHRSAS